jgi:hypothetical protein
MEAPAVGFRDMGISEGVGAGVGAGAGVPIEAIYRYLNRDSST